MFTTTVLKAVSLATFVISAFAVPMPVAENDVNRYIITLRSTVESVDDHIDWVHSVHKRSLSRRDAASSGVENTWDEHFKGYSGQFDQETLMELSSHDDVADIELDQEWGFASTKTQADAGWALGSISTRKTTVNSDYIYDDAECSDTFAYVVDSGINVAHVEFGGRATLAYKADPSHDDNDNSGHGTHVAGIIGSKTYGVCKATQIVGVKVIDAKTGSVSNILKGFNWAVQDIISKNRKARAVINLSFCGAKSAAFDSAVANAVQTGIFVVVGAGNNAGNTADFSPASAPGAYTVAAIDDTNTRAAWSNYGAEVNIFAPGSSIRSTYIGSNTATQLLSGTSMAAPFVSGVALHFMRIKNLPTPDKVATELTSWASRGFITNPGQGSTNARVYNSMSG